MRRTKGAHKLLLSPDTAAASAAAGFSGARVGGMGTEVRLTELAACGGCAAKYSAARLDELLAGFVQPEAVRELARAVL